MRSAGWLGGGRMRPSLDQTLAIPEMWEQRPVLLRAPAALADGMKEASPQLRFDDIFSFETELFKVSIPRTRFKRAC